MSFRRKESFRFVFNEPLDGLFSIYLNEKKYRAESFPCKIFDISPRGMKIFAELPFDLDFRSHVQFEVQFVLNISSIQALGEVVWSKPFSNGKQYGLFFKEQADLDELIISEMKIRRKKEVLGHIE